jgi:glycosyltransferase involved in cell wall biosynthesis
MTPALSLSAKIPSLRPIDKSADKEVEMAQDPTHQPIVINQDASRLKDTRPQLSVVVPCMNEELVIAETARQLIAVFESVQLRFELVFVDDGSKDQTPSFLRDLQAADPRIRVVRLSRNFGHQVAITAGLEHASGDAVAVIDADLQDPPEVLLDFVDKWLEGYDVVYGVRTTRDGETAFKRGTAKLFYRIIGKLSDTEIPLDTGDFRLMDRRVVDALLSMPERDRFVRGMVSWLGFSQVGVSYRRSARLAGETKYPLLKMLKFATDGIVSFSVLPLRVATWLGFLASGISLLGIGVVLLERYFHVLGLVRGWSSTVIAVLFIGGVQLVCMGIIGEYVGRIYGESKRRPLYIVRERMGFDSKPSEGAMRVRQRVVAGGER